MLVKIILNICYICVSFVLAVVTPSALKAKEKRSSAKQDSFKKKLFRVRRYSTECDICKRSALVALEAAHIIDHSRARELEAAYSKVENSKLPVSVNDASNGLLLCSICHTYFDAAPPCIRINGSGTILLYGDAKADKSYKLISNTKVAWSKHIGVNKDFPSSETLQLSIEWQKFNSKSKRFSDLQQDFDEEKEDEAPQKKKRTATKARVSKK